MFEADVQDRCLFSMSDPLDASYRSPIAILHSCCQVQNLLKFGAEFKFTRCLLSRYKIGVYYTVAEVKI